MCCFRSDNEEEKKVNGREDEDIYGNDFNAEPGESEDYNPFGHFSEEYVEKREKLYEQNRKKPRLTVRQKQIKKDNELWENNRLSRSGKKSLCFFLLLNYLVFYFEIVYLLILK